MESHNIFDQDGRAICLKCGNCSTHEISTNITKTEQYKTIVIQYDCEACQTPHDIEIDMGKGQISARVWANLPPEAKP